MKTTNCPFFVDDDAFRKLVAGYIVDNGHRIRSHKSQRDYRIYIFAFRRWLLANGRPLLSVDTVTNWMMERTQVAEVRTVESSAIINAGFCQYLVETGMVDANPFQMLKERHRSDGYRGIARLLKESGGAGVLEGTGGSQSQVVLDGGSTF